MTAKRIGEQGKAGSGYSRDIVNELRSVSQKVLTGIHLVGYTLLLSHVSFILYPPTGGTAVGCNGAIT